MSSRRRGVPEEHDERSIRRNGLLTGRTVGHGENIFMTPFPVRERGAIDGTL